MKSISVGIVTTVHVFGDPRIYHKQARSLADAGYEVSYIGKFGEGATPHPHIKHYFLPSQGFLLRLVNIFRALNLAVKANCRVYHLHDPELLPVGLLLKLLFRKKVVYDVHELYFDAISRKSYLSPKIAKALSRIYYYLDRFCLRIFDAFILAEESYQSFYQSGKSNVITIQNFISKRLIAEGVNSQLNATIKMVYVGGVTESRGIWEMVRLVELIRTDLAVELHIIGPSFSQELDHKIRDCIQQKKLDDVITLYGRMPYLDAQELLKEFDVGLILLHPIPNYETSIPTKLFEYMSKGLAVILHQVPLWDNFVRTNHCGISIDIFALEEHKERIVQFLLNAGELEKIKTRNPTTVSQYFTWEKEEQKLLDLYKRLHR